jgi:hypothetical protein
MEVPPNLPSMAFHDSTFGPPSIYQVSSNNEKIPDPWGFLSVNVQVFPESAIPTVGTSSPNCHLQPFHLANSSSTVISWSRTFLSD